MNEEMREMAVYHQLTAKKAEADRKIEEISRRADVFIRKVSWILVLALAVTMGLWLCLRFAGVYQVHDLVLAAIFSGIGVVVFFSFRIPSWRVGAEKRFVIEWLNGELWVSESELVEEYKRIGKMASGDERLACTYTHATRLAAQKALHEICDRLRSDFDKTEIPDDRSFYARVQELMRQLDDGDSVETSLEALHNLAGGDYPAPFSS